MKVCITAAIVLLLVITLVVINAVYVRRVTDDLLARLSTLPDTPNPDVTPQEIAAIKVVFDRRLPWLSLTAGFDSLDRVEESLIALEAHAEVGDVRQYASTRAVLEDLMQDIARTEKLSVEAMF